MHINVNINIDVLITIQIMIFTFYLNNKFNFERFIADIEIKMYDGYY